jgi:hypothetical protein
MKTAKKNFKFTGIQIVSKYQKKEEKVFQTERQLASWLVLDFDFSGLALYEAREVAIQDRIDEYAQRFAR